MTARLLALLLVLAAPAWAQTDTPAPPAEVPTPQSPKPPGRTEAARERQEQAKVEQHLGDLHRRLRITPPEEPIWDSFAQTMRDNAAHMEKLFRARTADDSMNAVEDLKSYAEVAEAHAQDMQRLLPAFEALYNAMTPEQQKLADTTFKNFEARGMRREPRM